MAATPRTARRRIGPAKEDLLLAARLDEPVLITAERDGRRKAYARLIHEGGGRRGRFVTFSATDAGTGDTLRRQFERARGGTFFIADITKLSADGQAQLFSLLDEQLRSHPPALASSGGDVRIIAGASRHLDAERATNEFRPSLFYRLNFIHINLIPRPVTAR